MAQYKNISGSCVSVPIVGHDVDVDEIVEVDDDVLMSTDYFVVYP